MRLAIDQISFKDYATKIVNGWEKECFDFDFVSDYEIALQCSTILKRLNILPHPAYRQLLNVVAADAKEYLRLMNSELVAVRPSLMCFIQDPTGIESLCYAERTLFGENGSDAAHNTRVLYSCFFNDISSAARNYWQSTAKKIVRKMEKQGIQVEEWSPAEYACGVSEFLLKRSKRHRKSTYSTIFALVHKGASMFLSPTLCEEEHDDDVLNFIRIFDANPTGFDLVNACADRIQAGDQGAETAWEAFVAAEHYQRLYQEMEKSAGHSYYSGLHTYIPFLS